MGGLLLGFAALSLVLAVTPGPDVFLVLSSAARAGASAGLLTAFGAALGSLLWAAAVGMGIAEVLAHSSAAYHVIRVLGALYLILLGARAVLSRPRRALFAQPTPQQTTLRTRHTLGAGLVSALFNPKIGLFFLAVVPQFLPANVDAVLMTVVFGLIDAVVALTWLGLVAYGAARLMRVLARPRVNGVLERVSGFVLIALGVTTLARQ